MFTGPWGIDMHPVIQLYGGGGFFDFEHPELSVYTIEGLAHSIAQLCRFTGHTSRHYSVAQHSVLVSHMVPPEFAYEGLMHDLHEAITGDASSPMKLMLPDYRALEYFVQGHVLARFGLSLPLHPSIKEADNRAVVTESRDFMPDDMPHLWAWAKHIRPLRRRILPLPAPMAKQLFLDRYWELTR